MSTTHPGPTEPTPAFDYTSRYAINEHGIPTVPAWMLSPPTETSTATAASPDPLLPILSGPLLSPGAGDDDDTAVAVLKGFRLLSLSMRDCDTGKCLWVVSAGSETPERGVSDDTGRGVSDDTGRGVSDETAGGEGSRTGALNQHLNAFLEQEVEAHLPASVLRCSGVTRAITFYSREAMKDFYMIQRLFLHGQLLEAHEFEFGFVIPNSTNTWEQMTEADTGNMLTAEELSGNLVVETRFFDKNVHISTAIVRIFYDT